MKEELDNTEHVLYNDHQFLRAIASLYCSLTYAVTFQVITQIQNGTFGYKCNLLQDFSSKDIFREQQNQLILIFFSLMKQI